MQDPIWKNRQGVAARQSCAEPRCPLPVDEARRFILPFMTSEELLKSQVSASGTGVDVAIRQGPDFLSLPPGKLVCKIGHHEPQKMLPAACILCRFVLGRVERDSHTVRPTCILPLDLKSKSNALIGALLGIGRCYCCRGTRRVSSHNMLAV